TSRAKRCEWLRDDLALGRELESVAAEYCRQHERRLGQGELAADALSWAAGEGEVGEAGPLCRTFGGESIGVEPLGLWPNLLRAMGQVRAQRHDGPRRDSIATDLVLLRRDSRDDPGRRIEPHRFFDHSPGPLELREVLHSRVTVPERAENLRAEALRDVTMAIEEVPRPREGRGRGLVAREEHGHHLVSDLAVVHPRSVRLFVARVQEERQEVIVSRRALRPPPRNDRG